MKKIISFFLIFAIVFAMGINCLCYADDTEADAEVYTYAPGLTVPTSFGTILFLDAAFCRTTEGPSFGVESNPTSVYVPAQDGFVQLGIKAILMNTSDKDYMYSVLHSVIKIGENEARTLNVYPHEFISNEAYTTLHSGATEYLCFCGVMPLDQYVSSKTALMEFDTAKVKFDFPDLKMYGSMGFGVNDCKEITLAELLAPAEQQSAPQQTPAPTPAPTEAPVETTGGSIDRTPEVTGDKAEGDAVTIQNVSVGFIDHLPSWVKDSSAYSFSGNKEDYELKPGQVFALISFTITNNTKGEIKLSDIKDNFMVEMNYNSGYLYHTDSNDYCIYESNGKAAFIKHSFSLGELTLAPLTTKDVRLLIPCAEEVSTETDKPLVVTFLSTYSGREAFSFRIR